MQEELIVQLCSPTLAGLKTGSLFSCPYQSERELADDVRRLNRRLAPKGVRVLVLRVRRRALIYLYRPSSLKKDLADDAAAAQADDGLAALGLIELAGIFHILRGGVGHRAVKD